MKAKLFITTASALSIAFSAHSHAAVTLGTAADFRILAGSTITNTGPTLVDGNIGVYPGTAITGFFGTVEDDGPGNFTGSSHQNDAVSLQAQSDANMAFTTLNGLPADSILAAELGNTSLTPGIYQLSSAELTGILTLNGGGDYVFQIGSTLNTAAASSINFINGADASNVFWAVGTSATFGTDTDFGGTIIADQSITFITGASLDGRAIALNAAVNLDTNTIIPEPSTISLLALLSMGLIVRRRRASH